MNKKKILYIESNLDGTIGGSHHCLYEIVKYVNRGKYSPVVIFYQENALTPDFRTVSEVFIYKQKRGLIIETAHPGLYALGKRSMFLKNTLHIFQKIHNFFVYYIPDLVSIYKFLKNNGIDVVHANNTPDLTDWLVISKLLNKKIISHLRYPWSPNATRKVLFPYYDKVISISNYVADKLKEINLPCNNVVTIHDGIDIEAVEKTNEQSKKIFAEFNIPTNAPVIGVIGNIRPWKGQHVAIEAMKTVVKKHADARCMFVGEISNSESDIKYLDYLKKSVSQSGLDNNIIFTGYRKDVSNILSNIDILVHTSIFPEPLGRVILEGMVFRKPVIATNHGGPLESIEDGISGFLLPPDNPVLLSEKISYLIENKEIARSIGDNARKRVESKFSIKENVVKIEKIYSDLLD
jgi:glycosyltransferase involved in cell wall biosynthesis